MNVNFNNVGFYNYNSANSQKPSFKSIQQFKTDIKMPDANEYLQKYNNSNFDEKKTIQDEYKQKIIDVCFDENGKLNPQIKDFLDNTLFDIKQHNGNIEKSTIKDYLKNSASDVYHLKSKLYHATSDSSVAEKIVQNGFNIDKISRTNLGPGFYFGLSEGDVNCYSSSILVADCEGKCANFKERFYQNLKDAKIKNQVAEFIGLNGKMTFPVVMWEAEALSKVLDTYTRETIVNDLGIDVAYGLGDTSYCYAVFNPNVISNIRKNEDDTSSLY